MEVTLRTPTAQDAWECGRVCYEAFAAVAHAHGFPPDFASVEHAAARLRRLIADPHVYGVVAERDGRLVGSNFLHERSLIAGVGPLTVDPAVHDRRIGRALMTAVMHRSVQRRCAGVRLLQVAYNNRSLSLYAKLGFDFREAFAALTGEPLALEVPGYPVRAAAEADVDACNELCRRVHGHDRAGELTDAIAANAATVVARRGTITGYATQVAFIGHAVAETNEDLQALIAAAEHLTEPGFLVPLRNTELLRWSLGHGLRVFYVMNEMTLGLYQEPRGAYLASIQF